MLSTICPRLPRRLHLSCSPRVCEAALPLALPAGVRAARLCEAALPLALPVGWRAASLCEEAPPLALPVGGRAAPQTPRKECPLCRCLLAHASCQAQKQEACATGFEPLPRFISGGPGGEAPPAGGVGGG